MQQAERVTWGTRKLNGDLVMLLGFLHVSRTTKLCPLYRHSLLCQNKNKHPKFPPTLQVLSFKVTSSRKPPLGQDSQPRPLHTLTTYFPPALMSFTLVSTGDCRLDAHT